MKNQKQNFYYFFKRLTITSLIFIFGFFDFFSALPLSWQKNELINNLQFNNALAATVGDGVMVYDQTTPTTNVQYRSWTKSTATVGSAASSFGTAAGGKHIFAKGSPTREETMLGIQDSNGLLTIYKSTDGGVNWVSQWTATVGDGNLRRFDIAYEQLSGNAFIIYSANVGTTNEIKYQEFDGTSWTGALSLDAVRTTGTVYGLKIAERAGTDEIGIVWVDTNLDLSANVWTGTAWYGEPAAALSVNIARTGGATPSAVPTERAYDLTFESLTGRLMIAWGDDNGTTQTDPKYIIKAAGGTWGTATSIVNLTEDGEMLDISSAPLSNRIALVTCSLDSGADCNFIVWSGTAWGTVASDTTSGSPIAGDGSNNTEWLASGANEVAIFTYNDAAAGGIDWYTSINGATPVAQTDNTTAPVVAGLDRAGFSKANPSDASQALFFFADANKDVFVKKASLSGTTVTWSSPTGATTAIETNLPFIGFNPIGFAYQRYIAPTPNVAVASVGTQIVNLNSSDAGQYVGAAFTLAQDQGTAQNISALTISGTGTVNSNTSLSNVLLRYENVASPDTNCVYNGTETATAAVSFDASDKAIFSGLSIPLAVGANFTCIYVIFDLVKAGVYPVGGQTIDLQLTLGTDTTFSGDATESGTFPVALSGTTTVRPVVTSYTNSTESALNYSGACTNCGARIGPGSPYRQTITISGYGFGTDPGLGSRDTATNKIEIIGAATDVLTDDASANTNVSAWSNTSITIRTDSNITGNTDTDWGTNYGGATALQITAGGQATPTDLNFYIFPQVTSLTVPTATANAAREYSASDSDGIITLNGTRFGSASTGGWVRILGCDSATCSSPSGTAAINSWSSTAIAVQVPVIISDSIYTGSLLMQQGTGTSNKSHTYTTTGFRVLPRLTSLSPTSGIIGAAVTVNGNHLCQNNATCPVAFDVNNRVIFSSAVPATVFTSWSNTAIVTALPTGAIDGVAYVLSNAYSSNNSAAFSVLTPAPNDPTGLNQSISSSLSSWLATGGMSSSTNLYLSMSMLTDFSGGTLYPQIEYKPIGTPFSCTGTSSCAQATEGTGKAGPGPVDCSLLASGCAITIIPTDGVYHWQARVRHFYGGSSYYSNWVPYGANGEGATDFQVDKTAPVITFAGGNTCTDAVTLLSTNGATISWNLNESANGRIEYSKNSNLTGSILTAVNSANFNHSYALNNLDSGATYYYQVKSVDGAGNSTLRPTISPYCSFTTTSVTQPAKTTKFYVNSIPGTLTGGNAVNANFSVYVPENAVAVKSAFLELSGFSPAAGTNNIDIAVNSQATSTYAISSSGNSFNIIHSISAADLNFDPINNILKLNSSADVNISSAILSLTYSFTP